MQHPFHHIHMTFGYSEKYFDSRFLGMTNSMCGVGEWGRSNNMSTVLYSIIRIYQTQRFCWLVHFWYWEIFLSNVLNIHNLIHVVMMKRLQEQYGRRRVTDNRMRNLLWIKKIFWNSRIHTEIKLRLIWRSKNIQYISTFSTSLNLVVICIANNLTIMTRMVCFIIHNVTDYVSKALQP